MRFTRLKIGQSETKELTVKNGINEPSIIGTVAGPFSFVSLKEITGEFPASSTIYFRENEVLQNANGEIATTDQGFGVAGTTDEDGKFTPNYALPSLTLDSPLESAKFKLNETITVKWTANNITLVNIVIESATGIKTVKNIDATLGTYDVDLTADTGDFRVNQEITIAVENVVGSIADSTDISSIATVTINTPTLTAGTEGNVTGTSNGVEVDIYYRVSSPEGAWQVFEEGVAVSGGNWSATGTIADANTYDFIAEDSTDRDGSAQVDDVVVASAYVEGKVILVANGESTYIAQLSVDSGANFSDIGGAIEDNTRGVALSADGKYGLLGGVGGYLIKIVDGIATTAVNVSAIWIDCGISDSGQYQIAISDSGYYFSNDYGVTWSAFQTAKAFTLCAINPTGQYISVFQNSGNAYFSNDYGASWNEVSVGDYCDSIRMSPDGAVVYVGYSTPTGKIKKHTSNGNSTLTIASSGARNIVCHNDGFFLLQTYGSDTLVSADYGVSFTKILVKPGTIYPGSGKLSPDGSIFYCNASNGYVYSLSSPWTEFIQKASGCYFWKIDCSYDGKYVVASRNGNGAGGIGYSDDYGVTFTTKLSTARNWSKIAISTKKLPS